MARLEWTDKLSVGIKEIDEDHKEVLRLLNKLNDLLESYCNVEELRKSLNHLILFVAGHYRNEEYIMKMHDYSEYNSHKTIHEEILEKLFNVYYSNKIVDYGVADIIFEVIVGWLHDHITVHDLGIKKYLNSKGVR
jgi:hemerythrin-like metal-binding protein